MRLTTATYYAVRALICMGKRYGTTVSNSDLCAEIDASENYMRIVITKLRRAGFVATVSGVHGGCMMVKEPKKVTLYDVISVVEGSPLLTPRGDAAQFGKDSVGAAMDQLQGMIQDYLTSVTIDSLMEADLKREKKVV